RRQKSRKAGIVVRLPDFQMSFGADAETGTMKVEFFWSGNNPERAFARRLSGFDVARIGGNHGDLWRFAGGGGIDLDCHLEPNRFAEFDAASGSSETGPENGGGAGPWLRIAPGVKKHYPLAVRVDFEPDFSDAAVEFEPFEM